MAMPGNCLSPNIVKVVLNNSRLVLSTNSECLIMNGSFQIRFSSFYLSFFLSFFCTSWYCEKSQI